jgi:AcrR family transcriptional regulator
MEPREAIRKTPDTSRSALLRAAKTLFAREGFGGTTVRDLAAEAGVNLCLISYHFGGKEGLYRACLEQFGRERLQAVGRIATPATTAEEFRLKLAMLVEAFYESHIREPEMVLILVREAEAGLPIARDIFESTFLVNMRRFVDFFRTAQKAGFVRADVDPLCLTGMIMGTFSHLVRMRPVCKAYFNRSIESEKEKEKLMHTLLTILTSGSLQS